MKLVCRDCGTTAEPKRLAKGSVWIEVILWLCWLIPGLIYSIWSRGSKRNACPVCGSASLVPVTSPVGRSLAPAELVAAAESPRQPSQGAVSAGHALGRMIRKLTG